MTNNQTELKENSAQGTDVTNSQTELTHKAQDTDAPNNLTELKENSAQGTDITNNPTDLKENRA